MRSEARFPSVSREAGHYESFYLKACDPAGGRAIWIRHTVHKRPGGEPTAAVWMTYFDDSLDAPRAAKRQLGAEALSTPDGSYIRIAESEIGPGWARGSVEAEGTAATWGLRFADRHDALQHLPREWMYRSKLPRTKLLSPHPGALFDGTFELDGERIEVSAWPGMVGHNWGSEHAERWIWIHSTAPDGAGGSDYLDIAAGRVRLGPATTPWILNGQLTLDGEEYRLGGLGRSLRADVDASHHRCELRLGGDGAQVRGVIEAPAERFVAWVYSDPGSGEHHALNCSIADLEMEVERPGAEPRKLRAERSAVYEFGSHDTSHDVPVQPFTDG